MKLDYHPETSYFTLRVRGRTELEVRELMEEYGLDLSTSESTPREAVLFTPHEYAAATFAQHATPAAFKQLEWIIREVGLSRAEECKRNFDVPEGEELAPFQKADLEYMLRRDRALDADQPGLGKTPTAIAYCNEIQAERVLVVCPAAIRRQWCQKIAQWSTLKWAARHPALTYPVESARFGIAEPGVIPYTVISYDLLWKEGIFEALMREEWDVIIADEIHFAKDMGTRRSRALWGGGRDVRLRVGLSTRAKRFVGLTGTPMPNRPREIYPVARHFHHDAIDFLSEEMFIERFNPSREKDVQRKDGSWAVITDERSGRHAELQNRLRANFMTRHLKRDVLKQLKLPEFDLIQVMETSAVRSALKAESLLGIDPDNLEGATATVLGHITTARRMMGEAIAPQVADWIKMLITGGEEKLVLFYWFIENGNIVMRELVSWLEKKNLYIARVDGASGAARKQEQVARFINDPRCALIMGNTLTLGTGTDGLQDVCNHVLLMEPDWVHGNNEQCVDRLDRWGQRFTVQADLFVAPNSVAEKVLASALRKGQVTHNALDRRIA